MLRTHRFGNRARCALFALALFAACAPKVQVEAPKQPIATNMNIKMEHETRIKVDKDLDKLVDEHPELF